MTKFKPAAALIAAVLCTGGMSPVESRECDFGRGDILVIGGETERASQYADRHNHCYFDPGTFDCSRSEFLAHCNQKHDNRYVKNCVWINEAMTAGLTIVDIGPDPRRNFLGPSYCMELNEICTQQYSREQAHGSFHIDCNDALDLRPGMDICSAFPESMWTVTPTRVYSSADPARLLEGPELYITVE